MSFAADKLYNGYVRRNMSTIVSRVKVREIMIHLPCLTAHDRDTIEAKRETSGNYNGMVLLLDCLKRRENWPEQFITALEACELREMAAEIRAEYETLKGVNNSSPGSLPATVVRAHVHPAPAAGHPPVEESSGNGPATVSLPPETAAPVTPPQETPTQQRAPQNPAGQVVVPPESVPEPPQIKLPSTPPPSPEIPRAQVNDAQLPRSEITSHQEPEENSESDIQNASGDTSNKVNAGREEAAANFVTTPQQHRQAARRGADPPSHPEPRTTAAGTNDKPQRAQMISDTTDGSSFPIMTPEKHPVQDTTPPVINVAAAPLPQPDEVSEPPTTPIAESSPLSGAAATASSGPLAGGTGTAPDDADDVCLSKPGQLMSVLPQNGAALTVASPGAVTEPYSGNSQRLEISIATDAGTTGPACSAVASTTADSVSALPCQENGIAPNHNEPEENHYESPCPSMEVLETVVHVSEEPSILNLDGQTEIINGEAAKVALSSQAAYSNAAEGNPSGLNIPAKESFSPSGPAPAHDSSEQNSEEKTAPQTTHSSNTKYIITAAGLCACALLIAWRFKK